MHCVWILWNPVSNESLKCSFAFTHIVFHTPGPYGNGEHGKDKAGQS